MSSDDESLPELLLVPCFSGAAWDVSALTGLDAHRARVLRLPEGDADLDAAADAVLRARGGEGPFVVAGDSFGAIVALTVALRRPRGLTGLVLSGGFVADPVPRWKTLAGGAARFVPDAVYRQAVLRFHAAQLRSRFDATGEVPLGRRGVHRLFVENTPRTSYAARVRSVTGFDVRARLSEITVPTLVLTPADDRLVGAEATRALVHGLPDVREVVLPGTGHLFRFTHPGLYSRAIAAFAGGLTPAASTA
jgi:pimeloyl-ACP methyl ester carboxylesterase